MLSLRRYLFSAVDDALVLSDLLIQLELGLDVLGRVGDADLDAAGDGSGNDALQEGVGPGGFAGALGPNSCSSNLG